MEITLPIIHGTGKNAADNDLLRFKGVQSVRSLVKPSVNHISVQRAASSMAHQLTSVH